MWALLMLVLGIGLCIGAALLALVPPLEKPVVFVPVYAVAMALFVGGLALVLWCQPVGQAIGSLMTG